MTTQTNGVVPIAEYAEAPPPLDDADVAATDSAAADLKAHAEAEREMEAMAAAIDGAQLDGIYEIDVGCDAGADMMRSSAHISADVVNILRELAHALSARDAAPVITIDWEDNLSVGR